MNAATKYVLDNGTPFVDSKGKHYVSLDNSVPVMDKEGKLMYVINKCQIVKRPDES